MRVSSEQRLSGDGLDRQESMLIRYFNDNASCDDFDPKYGLIVDRGVSTFRAEHLKERTGLAALFLKIREGNIESGLRGKTKFRGTTGKYPLFF